MTKYNREYIMKEEMISLMNDKLELKEELESLYEEFNTLNEEYDKLKKENSIIPVLRSKIKDLCYENIGYMLKIMDLQSETYDLQTKLHDLQIAEVYKNEKEK